VLDLSGRRSANSMETSDHPRHIGVDGGDPFAERDRCNRRGSVGADAWKLLKLGSSRREPAAADEVTGAGDQIASAGVIAKAGPFRENLLIGGGGKRLDRRPARGEPFESRRDGRDRRLLEHDLAQPHPIGMGRRFARSRAPGETPKVIHIMLQQARGGIGGHDFGMACSAHMSKRKTSKEESPRSCRPRSTGDLLGDVGAQSFRRFGFVQSSIVSRWPEIVGNRYARVSCPESIRFPTGKKAGGALTLLVDGAYAPLIQHLTPMIVERVNRFFGYAAVNRIVFRQGKVPATPARLQRPELRPVPKELGEGLREIGDPELRACLESLAAQIAATSGPPSVEEDGNAPIPVINSEQVNR
jgi:hypothetical protein